ncbi:MAG: NAD(P)-dependent alcohol dehydrogenase [Bacteroidetes bacterium]|nr:NAD(P)-dependent alcohol dehydrogenase [Bacteroidota bacterium]
MKAIVYTQYGSPDVLQATEVEKPVPADNEVLVRVRAVSLNASDWEFLTGSPAYVRMWGLLRPRLRILGSDIAGQVEAIGKGVRRFRPGDEVYGDILERKGGFAEYVCAPEKALTLKPKSMTFEQAAAIPQAATIALQSVRDKGDLRPGQRVLINGAGGGGGTFAVQFARLFGAEVTGVDSALKLDLMRSIGAHHVIDYTREDFTRNGHQYDLIVDFVARRSMLECRRALSAGGKYVLVGGSVRRLLHVLFMGPALSLSGGKKMGILAAIPNKDLMYVQELFETREVVPVIDRCFPLEEVPEALRYLGAGLAKGKVVITV